MWRKSGKSVYKSSAGRGKACGIINFSLLLVCAKLFRNYIKKIKMKVLECFALNSHRSCFSSSFPSFLFNLSTVFVFSLSMMVKCEGEWRKILNWIPFGFLRSIIEFNVKSFVWWNWQSSILARFNSRLHRLKPQLVLLSNEKENVENLTQWFHVINACNSHFNINNVIGKIF